MYHKSMTNKDKWEERLLSPKDNYERWIDKHNHKLELIRTIGSIIAAITGLLVLLKVFDFI